MGARAGWRHALACALRPPRPVLVPAVAGVLSDAAVAGVLSDMTMLQTAHVGGWPSRMVTRRRPDRPAATESTETRPAAEPGAGPDSTDTSSDDAIADPAIAEVWTWVRAAQAGDADAFGRIYDRYVETVYRYVYYRVADHALAEDLTSETFLRALRRLSGVTYQGRDLAAWFVTIARNLIFDHTKSARYRLELTTDEFAEGGFADTGSSPEDGPEALLLSKVTNERLLLAVRELPEEQQECIVLRFLQGLNVAETAEVMGKNEGAVKAMQHRAVRRLHTALAAELS